MRARSALAVFVAAALAHEASAQPVNTPDAQPIHPPEGEPGAPPVGPPIFVPSPPPLLGMNACASHTDCIEGFRCLQNRCVDNKTFDETAHHDESLFYSDQPPVGYFGVAIGPLALLWNGNFFGGGQLGLRLGTIVAGHLQLQLDVAPGTTIGGGGPGAIGMFEACGTIGYLIRINPIVAWILRIGGGGGFSFGNDSGFVAFDTSASSPEPFGEIRLDVSGFAIQPSKRLLLELNIPSYRIMISPNQVGMSWVTNVAFNYIF
jgi:hypothetical protein